MIPKLSQIGLKLNSNKCEVAFLSASSDNSLLPTLSSVLPDLKVRSKCNLTLFNSPIFYESINSATTKYEVIVNSICNKIKTLDPHTGLFFLSHHSSAPRLNYLLHTAPMHLQPERQQGIDDNVKDTAINISNVQMDDKAWKQASLPVRHGGVGLCSVGSLALPCYLSSLNKSEPIVRQLLKQNNLPKFAHLLQAE